MMRDRKLLVGGIIVFGMLCTIAVIGYFVYSSQPQKEDSEVSSDYVVYAPLQVDGFSAYAADISSATQTSITTSLQRYIDTTNSTTTIKGVIRSGSYSKANTSDTMSVVTFLIDFSGIQRTYKISIGSDTSTGENSLYVLCPTTAELRYPPFNCKDDLSSQE
jgi:hypothetical protein